MNFAQLLFPDFSLILCGYLVCRFTKLNRPVWEQVESLVYYFLFPVLLFQSIVKNPLDLGAASALVGAAVSLALCAIALTYSLPHWPWLGRRIDVRLHAASAQVGFRFNSFILLALADRIAGPQALLMVAVIIGCCVPIFNVGAVWPMARHANKGFGRELLRNPLIIATASGLLANLLGFSLPDWLSPTVNRIGQASLALGLMAAGAGMQFGSMAS
ncbi:AEC family transporter, partial [Hydrogenophaga sp. 70-12]